MKRTLTPFEWFLKHVDGERLLSDTLNALKEAVDFNYTDDDGNYLALVSDIVSSGHGQYIPLLALEYFDYETEDDLDEYDLEETINELECFTGQLADIINEKIFNEKVGVHFGFWEADGSYCLMAILPKENLKWLEDRI